MLHSIFRCLTITCLGFCFTAQGNGNNFESYIQLIDKYPQLGPMGDASQKEIEIIRDPIKMQEIEKSTGRPVGILIKDCYFLWLNDPVKFPNGKHGIYSRLLWTKSLEGRSGVVVMPMLPDGRVVLNLCYRHPTRSWEFELPRGMIEPGESIQEAAKREAKEETGMVISELHLLGNMAVDTGLTNAIVPIFIAKVDREEESTPEDSESIINGYAFSIQEIRQGFMDGFISVEEFGEVRKVPMRDSFTAYALFLADLKHLIEN